MSLSYRRVLLFGLTISLIALSTLTSDKSHAAFEPTHQLSRIFSRASSFYLSIDSTNPDRDDPQKTVIAGFDFGNLDRSVSACQDFNQFANGGWMAKNPIPGAFSVWGRFTQLDEQNILVLNQILEDLLKKKNLTGNEKKIDDYYGSCMDEQKIEAEGIKPLDTAAKFRIELSSDDKGSIARNDAGSCIRLIFSQQRYDEEQQGQRAPEQLFYSPRQDSDRHAYVRL